MINDDYLLSKYTALRNIYQINERYFCDLMTSMNLTITDEKYKKDQSCEIYKCIAIGMSGTSPICNTISFIVDIKEDNQLGGSWITVKRIGIALRPEKISNTEAIIDIMSHMNFLYSELLKIKLDIKNKYKFKKVINTAGVIEVIYDVQFLGDGIHLQTLPNNMGYIKMINLKDNKLYDQ